MNNGHDRFGDAVVILEESMTCALLLIDIQQGIMDKKPKHLTNFAELLDDLLLSAKGSNCEVIWIRHHDKELPQGSPQWEIWEQRHLVTHHKIIDKTYNSCFKDTHLHDYLQSKHISQLIMMGLQTEYCFDTSLKVAFEYGYDIFIPQGGHLTFDTPTLSGDSIKKHYENIWHHRFATMVAKDSLLKLINEE